MTSPSSTAELRELQVTEANVRLPARLIRDGLLDSERYWSVRIEAQRLFFHLLLSADDFGLVSLAPVFVRRRCFNEPPAAQELDSLLEELNSADLIRQYSVGVEPLSARYAFIPRYGQRLRMMRCKHPMPPERLFQDDNDAHTKFLQNKDLFDKLSARRRQPAAMSLPEVEGKRKEVELKPEQTRKGGEQSGPIKGVREWARELGLERGVGEQEASYQIRVAAAVQAHKLKDAVPSS